MAARRATVTLPEDLWRNVFSMCSVETKLSLPRVCKAFSGVAKSMQRSIAIRLLDGRFRDLQKYTSLQKLTVFVGEADYDLGRRVMLSSAACDVVLKIVFVGRVEMSHIGGLIHSLPWETCLAKIDVKTDIVVLDGGDVPDICSKLVCNAVKASMGDGRDVYPFRHLHTRTCPALNLASFARLQSLCIEDGRCRDLALSLGHDGLPYFPDLTSLSVQSFKVSACESIERLTKLCHLEMRACEFSVQANDIIFPRAFARVRNLHLVDCDLPNLVDVSGMTELRVLRIDNSFDDAVWLVGRNKLKNLQELYVRNATCCVEEMEGWTSATRVELVDCLFDSELVSIYHKLLKASPQAYCLLGFTVGPAEDEHLELQEMYDAVYCLTISHQKLVMDNSVTVRTCVGSRYFNNVKSLLYTSV